MVDHTNTTHGEVADASLNEDKPVVLSVEHVSKSFRLPTEQASGLKQAFINWTKGIKGYTEQSAPRYQFRGSSG